MGGDAVLESAAALGQRASPLRDLPWLMRHVARAAPVPLTAWALLTGLRAAQVAANLFAIHGAVNALAGTRPAQAGAWLVALAVIFAAGRLADPLEAYAREALRIAAGGHLQNLAQEKTLRLPLEAFDSEQTHDLIRRVAEGADSRGPELVGESLKLLRTLPETVAYAAAAALIASWLPAALAVATALLCWQLMRSGARVRALETLRTRDRRLADYYADLLTTRQHAAEVRLFGLRAELLTRWRNGLSSYMGDRARLLLRNAIAGAASNAGFTAVLAGSLLAVVVVRHRVDPGSAALVLTAIGGLVNTLAGLAFSGREFVQHAGYARDLRGLLDGLPVEDGTPAARTTSDVRATTDTRAPGAARGAIRLEDVCYRYPGTSADALAGVSAEIGAGEIVALVGPNGAGKSTLAALLLGLRRPTAGRIVMDGTDLAQLPLADIRDRCAGVFQQPLRLPASVRENVAAGAAAGGDPATAVRRVLELVDLPDLAAPAGGGTERLLGPEFGGTDLSGGQWQRLSIARGLFRSEAEWIVFDEPTAALDPLAELALFERFASLAAGRTAILISHRLGPTRLADRVLVLDRGRLVEQGPPQQLLAAGGLFARMFESQAEWYR